MFIPAISPLLIHLKKENQIHNVLSKQCLRKESVANSRPHKEGYLFVFFPLVKFAKGAE
jgi:hypothetical protein